jgi:hypothetical protein
LPQWRVARGGGGDQSGRQVDRGDLALRADQPGEFARDLAPAAAGVEQPLAGPDVERRMGDPSDVLDLRKGREAVQRIEDHVLRAGLVDIGEDPSIGCLRRHCTTMAWNAVRQRAWRGSAEIDRRRTPEVQSAPRGVA